MERIPTPDELRDKLEATEARRVKLIRVAISPMVDRIIEGMKVGKLKYYITSADCFDPSYMEELKQVFDQNGWDISYNRTYNPVVSDELIIVEQLNT